MYFFEFMDGGLLSLSWWQIIFAALLLTHVTIAGVTIFLHRCQTHRGLDLHPIASHFFRVWLWLTTGMLTKEWVAIHRKHHAKCETDDDPHSPQRRGLRKVFWEGSELYMAEAANVETLAKYGHGTPDDWLERNVYSHFTWHGVGIMAGIDLMLFGWAGLAVWSVQMMWIPIFAAGVINGVGHFWGYRNFDSPDASANIVPWGLLIGGEEMHNNHHTYPTSAKFSAKWYEFDLGWTYIRVLQALGLAKVLRVLPKPQMAQPKRLVDLDTLQAVIANRYDLLARYARDLRRAFGDELSKMPVSTADRDRFARLRRWLRKSDVSSIPAADQQALSEVQAHSRVVSTLLQMRAELAKTWERSSSSREQVLQHLQEWIVRAETSGIRALQDLALRIRSYHAAPQAA